MRNVLNSRMYCKNRKEEFYPYMLKFSNVGKF